MREAKKIFQECNSYPQARTQTLPDKLDYIPMMIYTSEIKKRIIKTVVTQVN